MSSYNSYKYLNTQPPKPSLGKYSFNDSVIINTFSPETAKSLNSQITYNFKKGDVIDVKNVSYNNTKKQWEVLSMALTESHTNMITTANPEKDRISLYIITKVADSTPISVINSAEIKPNTTTTTTTNTNTNTNTNTTSNPSSQIETKVEGILTKSSYVFLGISWLVNGVIAYKFWNKSKNWKIGISIITLGNLYYTYDFLQKKSKGSYMPTTPTPTPSPSFEAPKGSMNDVIEKEKSIKQFIKDLEQAKKPISETQKKELEKLKSLSLEEIKIFLELQKELLTINQSDGMDKVLKKMGEFQQKYGDKLTKIQEKINKLNLQF